MYWFWPSFAKEGETIQGGIFFKGGYRLRKYGISSLKFHSVNCRLSTESFSRFWSGTRGRYYFRIFAFWLNFFDHIMNNHWYHQNHCTFLFPMMYLSSQSIQVGPWSNLYLIQAFLLLSLDQGWILPWAGAFYRKSKQKPGVEVF